MIASRQLLKKSATWFLLTTAPVFVGACQAKASNELLATDLAWLEAKDGWNRSITIDPWLAYHPDLVRSLRATRIANMKSRDAACDIEGGGCEDLVSFEVQHDGKRFVSVLETTDYFGGGAHGSTDLRDHLFDLRSGEEMRFGDLFDSWKAVRPLMQRAMCQQLRNGHPDLAQCPDVQHQAITLHGTEGLRGRINRFEVDTQDYALGSYSDGRDAALIDIDQALYSHIKPEYRAEFEPPASSESSRNDGPTQDPPAAGGGVGAESAGLSSEFAGPRGPGKCHIGNPMQFTGGWAVGTGHIFFVNPLNQLKRVLDAAPREQQRTAEADPLKFDERGGCTGISRLDPMIVRFGRVVEGDDRFATVRSAPDTSGQSCLIVVQASNLICGQTSSTDRAGENGNG